MIKKCTVWILIFIFLSLVITPTPAFARAAGKYRYFTAEEPLLIAGGVLVTFLVILIIVKVATKTDKALDSSSSEEPINKEQRSKILLNINDEIATLSGSDEKYGKKDQNSKTLLNASDDFVTPSGNVVVFKW